MLTLPEVQSVLRDQHGIELSDNTVRNEIDKLQLGRRVVRNRVLSAGDVKRLAAALRRRGYGRRPELSEA